MPNSPTTASPNLYFPESYARGSSAGTSGTTMPALLERSLDAIEDYARREPWAFAGWVFGVGFILGWKLKPW